MLALFRPRKTSALRAGVSIAAHGTAIAVVSRDHGGVRLTHCEYLPASQAGNFGQVLRERDLDGAALSIVVQPEDYQLVLIEAPEVLPAELRAAVRWRLKDLINFNIEDAVVDVFDIPDQSRRVGSRSTYAVAARSNAIDRYAALAKDAKHELDVVDIPELCARNLCSLTDADRTGVALLLAGERSGKLLLVRNGVLYLARHIDWPQSHEPGTIDAGTVALEVQRSLDYFESHYDQSPIGELLVAPLDPALTSLANRVRSEVGLKVGTLDLSKFIACPPNWTPELQSQCLMAIGAALRHEQAVK